MRRPAGFTLVELMVVIAIVGILAATAVPAYRTWRERAYASEVMIMMKLIIEAQIIYNVNHNTFFPAPGQSLRIPPDDPPTAQVGQWIQDIKQALNLAIPVGHKLEYFIEHRHFKSLNVDRHVCHVEIIAPFPIFKNGDNTLINELNDKGIVEPSTWYTPPRP